MASSPRPRRGSRRDCAPPASSGSGGSRCSCSIRSTSRSRSGARCAPESCRCRSTRCCRPRSPATSSGIAAPPRCSSRLRYCRRCARRSMASAISSSARSMVPAPISAAIRARQASPRSSIPPRRSLRWPNARPTRSPSGSTPPARPARRRACAMCIRICAPPPIPMAGRCCRSSPTI